LKKNLEYEFQRVFSRVYVGSEKIQIANSSFSFLLLWNFFEIISEGEIHYNNNKITTIGFDVTVTNYIVFWCMVTFLILVAERYYGLNNPSIFALPLVWGGMIFLFTQISHMRFRSKNINSITASKGNVIVNSSRIGWV
jgi:hypothetical protein